MTTDVQGVIDFFFNSVLNLWNKYYTTAPQWAKITFVIIVVIPLLKKIIGNLLTHARTTN